MTFVEFNLTHTTAINDFSFFDSADSAKEAAAKAAENWFEDDLDTHQRKVAAAKAENWFEDDLDTHQRKVAAAKAENWFEDDLDTHQRKIG